MCNQSDIEFVERVRQELLRLEAEIPSDVCRALAFMRLQVIVQMSNQQGSGEVTDSAEMAV